MKKKFTLWQLFSIVDGRLSTSIGDVYEILNHVCDDELFTHHLLTAMSYTALKYPKWFGEVASKIQDIKNEIRSDNFSDLRKTIEGTSRNIEFDIPQLKDEVDTSDYGTYMVDNSLLLKRFA